MKRAYRAVRYNDISYQQLEDIIALQESNLRASHVALLTGVSISMATRIMLSLSTTNNNTGREPRSGTWFKKSSKRMRHGSLFLRIFKACFKDEPLARRYMQAYALYLDFVNITEDSDTHIKMDPSNAMMALLQIDTGRWEERCCSTCSSGYYTYVESLRTDCHDCYALSLTTSVRRKARKQNTTLELPFDEIDGTSQSKTIFNDAMRKRPQNYALPSKIYLSYEAIRDVIALIEMDIRTSRIQSITGVQSFKIRRISAIIREKISVQGPEAMTDAWYMQNLERREYANIFWQFYKRSPAPSRALAVVEAYRNMNDYIMHGVWTPKAGNYMSASRAAIIPMLVNIGVWEERSCLECRGSFLSQTQPTNSTCPSCEIISNGIRKERAKRRYLPAAAEFRIRQHIDHPQAAALCA